MYTLVLLAAVAIPAPQSTVPEVSKPIAPEQVLAWQLGGLTQEEIQDEVRERGLREYLEVALLSALSAAGADEEMIRVLQVESATENLEVGITPARPDGLFVPDCRCDPVEGWRRGAGGDRK